MSYIRKILAILNSPKLSYATLRSKVNMYNYKSENVFKSECLNDLFSSKFIYKGSDKNTIFCKNRMSGEPIPITVELNLTKLGRTTEELYTFKDATGKIVGFKRFGIEDHPRLGKSMLPGAMENKTDDIIGIGIRGDQIQIERALDNNITVIPREAAAQATLFHAKMGFLPCQGELIEIKSYKDAIKQLENFDIGWGYKTFKKIKPIVIMKEGRFFLDLNKTNAQANIQEVKWRLQNSDKFRESFRGNNTDLTLSGDELKKWSELIGDNKITSIFDYT